MAKKLLFAFGISIIIGIIIGFFTSGKIYYFMVPENPKREITYQNYLWFLDKTEYKEEDYNALSSEQYTWTSNYAKYSRYIKEEKVYNTQYAIIAGLVFFGISSIVISFIKKSQN